MNLARIAAIAAFLVLASCSPAPTLEGAEDAGPPPAMPESELTLDAVRDAPIELVAVGDHFRAQAGGFDVDIGPEGTIELAARAGTIAGAMTLRTQADATGAATVVRSADGASLEIPRADATEIIRAGMGAIEQSWRVGSRPDGDLVIRVQVERARFAVENDSGLHFTSDEGLGFVYSHATWIDARGTRVPVPARWTGSLVELRVPADVLARSGYPAVLDPTITAETGIDDPLRVAHLWAYAPTVLFDGTQWWVAYTDTNRGASIRLVRVSTSGAVLDVDGISVVASDRTPTMALAGDRIFLTWTAAPPPGGSGSGGIRVARVLLDGTVLDSTPIVLTLDSFTGGPLVASDGTDALVSWQFYGTGDRSPIVRRVLRDGSLPETDPVRPVPSASVVTHALGYANGHYVFGWVDSFAGSEVRAVRIRPSDATVADASPVTIATSATASQVIRSPSFATEGTALVLAWNEFDDAGPSYFASTRLAARVVGADGALGTGPISVLPLRSDRRVGPIVTSDGDRTYAIWADGTATTPYAAAVSRISAAGFGPPVAVAPTRVAGDRLGAAIAPTPTGALAVWESDRVIRGRRLATDETWIDPEPFPIALAGNEQRGVRSAYGAGVHLVAWTDLRDAPTTGTDVYAARVSNDGALLDPVAIPITTSVVGETVADVDFDGTDFVVTWEAATSADTREVWARRVSPAGAAAASGTSLATARGMVAGPCLSWNGTNHLLAWMDWTSGASFRTAFIQRLDRDLTPLGPATSIDPLYQTVFVQCEQTAGLHWIFRTWDPPGIGLGRDVRRVRPDGTFLDATPVSLGVTQDARSAVTPTGGISLSASSSSTSTSYSAWYLAAGSTSPMSTSIFTQPSRSGFWLGGGWNGRELIAVGRRDASDASFLFGVPFSESGVPGARYDITPAITGLGSASVSSSGDGRALVVYDRQIDAPPFGVRRVRARWIGDPLAPPGAPCSDAATCASGFCTDGVCCDEACGGGLADDCQACAVAAGAAVDGTCAARPSGTACRASAGVCDMAESCDGLARSCPIDGPAADGTPCSDGLACNGEEACGGGACVAGAPPACDDADPCTTDACAEPTGCAHTPIDGCGDAGPPDAGPPDAGPPDAGPPDAGPPDAGPPDAGPPDAGIDAGIDAGRDAGRDAGADAGPPTPVGGCGCRATGARGASSVALALGAMLAWMVGRLRRRRGARR